MHKEEGKVVGGEREVKKGWRKEREVERARKREGEVKEGGRERKKRGTGVERDKGGDRKVGNKWGREKKKE